MKSTPSIIDTNFGVYYTSFQQIYFNDLCQYLYDMGDLNDLAFQDCKTILDGKLK